MTIRKATRNDIIAVTAIYDAIHTEEEQGRAIIGWNRVIYPTQQTAEHALEECDLFVMEVEGEIVAAAIINQEQVPCYSSANWKHKVDDKQVMVLHTLTVHPQYTGCGYGKDFVDFYEHYALEHGCSCLRMDTNEKNCRARQMYAKLGYEEIDIVPTTFNGIEGVNLVCLEKILIAPSITSQKTDAS